MQKSTQLQIAVVPVVEAPVNKAVATICYGMDPGSGQWAMGSVKRATRCGMDSKGN